MFHPQADNKFLAIVAHEIRTPVNSILGFASLLAEKPLCDRQRTYIHTIISSAEAMLHIMDDILDFAGMESGAFRIEAQAFVVRSLVEGVWSLLALQAEQRNILFKIEIAADVPEKFIGDAGRLRQVLINLVSNAIKFTDEGHVTIAVHGESACLFFSVEDTGVGIPVEKLETIFDPFNGCQKNGGRGLGLAISKRLVELMGASLRVESELGVGTRFFFGLKLKTSFRQDYRIFRIHRRRRRRWIDGR